MRPRDVTSTHRVGNCRPTIELEEYRARKGAGGTTELAETDQVEFNATGCTLNLKFVLQKQLTEVTDIGPHRIPALDPLAEVLPHCSSGRDGRRRSKGEKG